MDRKRSRPHRVRSNNRIPFRIDVFEQDVRKALGADASLRPGLPNSDAPVFDRGPSTAGITYLLSEMLSKYDDGQPNPSKKTKAFEKFWEAEEMCFWRNLFFSQNHDDIVARHPGLNRAREFIHEFFGQEVQYDRIARGFGFSSGASTRLKKQTGDPAYKYSATAEVTPNAYSIAVAAINSGSPIWKQMYDGVVDPPKTWGNRLDTVPKNYKIDRVIAVEPCLNMYVQKGLGSFIRQRLTRYGIDLDKQENNQKGAFDLGLATVDFSMASDCVSQGLVYFLLPPNWCDLIALMRSEFGVLPDKTLFRYNKVSSMGNGFTFELETVIFLALARAVVPQEEHNRILVYGDDVLLPKEYAPAFIELASIAGFKPNEKKSFWQGPFRESCGVHTHSGYDISPFYIKEKVSTLDRLFLVHNNLWRWRKRLDNLLTPFQYAAIGNVLRKLRYLAPSKWRKPRLPDGFGDGAFIGSFAEVSPTPHPDGWEYFIARVFEAPADVRDCEVPGLLVKSELNLHRRTGWMLPRVMMPMVSRADPMKEGVRREREIVLPWAAWGY